MSIIFLNNRLVYVGKVRNLMTELRKLPISQPVLTLIRQRLN